MTASKDPRPASQRIADDLRAAIDAGEIAPGEKLPTTKMLVERYSVTAETVRQAVMRLKAAGVVTSKQGGGVYARSVPPLKRLGIHRYDKARWRDRGEVAFMADRIASGRDYARSDQTQVVSRIPASRAIAAGLGVPEGTEVVSRARLIKESGIPTHMLTSYYKVQHVEGTPLENKSPGPAGNGGGFGVFLEIGLEPHQITEELYARMPTPTESSELSLPAGEPVMILHRTTYTADGTVIEYAIGVHAASRFAWEYSFTIPDTAESGSSGNE